MEALANTVVASSDPSYTGDGKGKEKKLSLVEDPAGHITLKKILACDRELMHQGKDGEGGFCLSVWFTSLFVCLMYAVVCLPDLCCCLSD